MPIYLILTVLSRLGKTVGGSPWITILVSLIVCAVCMIGFLRFEQESRGEKLWVPSDAKAQSDKEWVEEMFPEESAQVNFILEESNVLTADIMKQVHWYYFIQNRAREFATGYPNYGDPITNIIVTKCTKQNDITKLIKMCQCNKTANNS